MKLFCFSGELAREIPIKCAGFSTKYAVFSTKRAGFRIKYAGFWKTGGKMYEKCRKM